MFGTLPESQRRRERRLSGIVASAVAHALVIVAVAGTARAGSPPAPPDESIVRITPPSEPHVGKTKPSAPRPARRKASAPGDGPVLRVPERIDVELPPVDATAPPIDEPGFGAGADSTVAGAGARNDGGPGTGNVFGLASVERPVTQLPAARAIRYPSMLRGAGIEGSVSARFVVDTLGRVEPGSFVVLASRHASFTASVREALGGLRFVPAEAGGRRVRQLVEQRFDFQLAR
jgi:protein TonB